MRQIYLPRHVVLAIVAAAQRPALGPPLPVAAQRRWLDAMAATLPLPSGAVVRPVRLGARPAERVTVGATERSRAILYLHGGAYTVGSPRSHRSMAAFLARAADAVVYTLDYRLAPEHPYPAASDDAVAAFVALTAAYFADRIAIAGDSAGGGLSVTTARSLIDHHGMTPAALGLISPWVDLLEVPVGRQRDAIVTTKWGRICAAGYAAGHDLRDPALSPINGDLHNLPPTLVHLGRTEILYPQVTRFVDWLRAAGVDVSLTEFPWLWHVGHAHAAILREGQRAVDELGAFLRRHTSDASSAAVPTTTRQHGADSQRAQSVPT